MTNPSPPTSREQEAREILRVALDGCTMSARQEYAAYTAIIAAVDAERERCAALAQHRADMIQDVSVAAALALMIALPDAIRNPKGDRPC